MQKLILSADTAVITSETEAQFYDCHRIIYVWSGKARAEIDEKKYLLKSGTLLLINRFEKYSAVPLGESYKCTELRISPDIVKENIDSELYYVIYNRPDGFCHAIGTDEDTSKVETILSEISEELSCKFPFYEKVCNSSLEKLLIMIYRSLPELFGTPSLDFSDIVKKVQLKLENNYGSNINISDICSELNISASHLAHIFKKQTGYSVMEYLMELRIIVSKRMLAETELPVSEIIKACGFHDASNFSRMFRNSVGVTPSDFRKQYKK